MKVIWRLKEQPSTQSLRELVKDKILTNEEARQILFSSENEEERDRKSLEAEIKFLRELVEKLSQNRETIIDRIQEVEKLYRGWTWYQPYHQWSFPAQAADVLGNVTTISGTQKVTTAGFLPSGINALAGDSFSSIKTF